MKWIVALIWLSGSSFALGESAQILDLHVREKLVVYEKADSKSKQVTVLDKGDIVVISKVEYGAFRKVLVTYGGKRSGGYIQSNKIVLSKIIERGQKEQNPILQARSLAFELAGTLAYQFAGPLEASGFPNAEASDMLGFDTSFAIGVFWPHSSKTRGVELRFGQKNWSVSGDAEFVTGAGREKTTVDVKSFFVSGFFRFYQNASSQFWYGLGLDVGQVTDVKIKVSDGQDIPYSGSQDFYYLPVVGLGIDLPLNQKWVLSPSTKMNVNITENNPVIGWDFSLMAHWFY